jgi:hypothetical protein
MGYNKTSFYVAVDHVGGFAGMRVRGAGSDF